MRAFNHLLIAFVSLVFVCGTVGLVTFSDSEAYLTFKKAFPEAALIKKLFSKTVCGTRNPGQRFVTSKDEKEVCDRTTGNIFEQDPDSFDGTNNPDGRMPMEQGEAIAFCATLGKGHGQVYELPSVQQLVSVLDYTQEFPALTPGVFTNVVPNSAYWSASPFASAGMVAWGVSVGNGFLGVGGMSDPNFVWCVRRDKDAHAAW